MPRLRQQCQFSSGSIMNSSSKNMTETYIRTPLHTGASMQPDPAAKSDAVGGDDGADEEVEPSDMILGGPRAAKAASQP